MEGWNSICKCVVKLKKAGERASALNFIWKEREWDPRRSERRVCAHFSRNLLTVPVL